MQKRDLLQDGLGESAIFHATVVMDYKVIGEIVVDGQGYDVAIDKRHANPIIVSQANGKNLFVPSFS